MAYVHVDVDLSDFDDDALVEELEERGYRVDDLDTTGLTDFEKDVIADTFARAKPGTIEFEIYEKMRKR